MNKLKTKKDQEKREINELAQHINNNIQAETKKNALKKEKIVRSVHLVYQEPHRRRNKQGPKP